MMLRTKEVNGKDGGGYLSWSQGTQPYIVFSPKTQGPLAGLLA